MNIAEGEESVRMKHINDESENEASELKIGNNERELEQEQEERWRTREQENENENRNDNNSEKENDNDGAGLGNAAMPQRKIASIMKTPFKIFLQATSLKPFRDATPEETAICFRIYGLSHSSQRWSVMEYASS
jgi:uncharacterized protein YPO0396